MPVSDTDQALLLRAVALAEQSIGLSDPNPRVGCVLRTADGQLAGEGFTQQAGGPHAEVMAMRAAAAAGHALAGGTAWVSLEPCAHHGRTPPCADALIAAGLARVVIAMGDPFAQVAGRGIQRLRAAGIVVDLADGGPACLAAQALNIGFLSRVQRGLPWVRLKVAASLDGRTALPDGRSQWITGSAARRDGHAWRRRAGAVLSGIGTVVADDPQLDVRLVPTQLQPLRVVVDSGFNTPPGARLLQVPGRALVVGAQAHPERMAALRAAGAELLLLPAADGRVDLAGLLQRLAADGVSELHVEAGAVLNAALLGAGLADELLVYTAPKLLGPGLGMAALPPLAALDQALAFDFEDCQRVGDDLRLLLRRRGAADFLQHRGGQPGS
jgi:diaminohydroxyphosphoribosylaminopyrimidine deaminase / 5-amino-6-(5-phosphoribosylamino)uracil reductase